MILSSRHVADFFACVHFASCLCSECADRKSLLVQLQILRLNDYIDREKQAPPDSATDALKIERFLIVTPTNKTLLDISFSTNTTICFPITCNTHSFDITKEIPQWITEIHDKKEVLKPDKAKKARLEQQRQEKYDSVNLIKARNLIKMEDFIAPDHADQYVRVKEYGYAK